MKAAFNGVPSLSVLDGWWIEGCIEGATGWAIENADTEAGEADSLYEKLEKQIAPLYANPTAWAVMQRHCVAVNGSFFNTHRMLQQYFTNAYFPKAELSAARTPPTPGRPHHRRGPHRRTGPRLNRSPLLSLNLNSVILRRRRRICLCRCLSSSHPTPKSRHPDRSSGRFHRPLRSGGTPRISLLRLLVLPQKTVSSPQITNPSQINPLQSIKLGRELPPQR